MYSMPVLVIIIALVVYNANPKSYLLFKAYILGLVTSVVQYNNSLQCKHRVGLGRIPNLAILVHRHFLKIVFY